jgi:small redox-active disulfide protein 2
VLKIEMLGPGCPKCDGTFDKAKQVLAQLELEAELAKITDVFQIINRGVSFTPDLVLNGQVVFQGKVPSLQQIRDILTG